MKQSPDVAPKPLLLAVETSGDVCSVAALRVGAFAAEHRFRHEMRLSERLFGIFDAVLHDAGATLADVSAFAVGIGPGSFTGTRIGVMTMKTLAFVSGRPVFGVGGMEALAAEWGGLRDTIVVPLLSCRTEVVYAGLFTVEEKTPVALIPPDALPLEELIFRLAAQQTKRVLFCGPAALRYGEALRQVLEPKRMVVSLGSGDDPRALRIAELAATRLLANEPPDDPISLVPLYIAPPPITLPKQPFPSMNRGDVSGESAG